MDKENLEEIIDFAFNEAFNDLSSDIKLELQKRKRKLINRAHWKNLDMENKKREQYM